MRLENDHAIIENLAEYELFFRDTMYLIESYCDDFFKLVYSGKCEVSKERVKEKLIPHIEDTYFRFLSIELYSQQDSLPNYCFGYTGMLKKEGHIGPSLVYIYNINVNQLTINKSIRKLYELGKWCDLWK